MFRTCISFRNARFIVSSVLLALTLSACGGTSATPAGSTNTDQQPSTAYSTGDAYGSGDAAYDSSDPTSAKSAETVDAGGPGIDQTKLDVCAMLPRDKVEGAIGALTEEPKPSILIGNEVGCDYTADQGRGYSVEVYNLDRWDLLPQTLDTTPVAGIGDGAYKASLTGSDTTLFVLRRDWAVVGVQVNGADTPQFRKLLDLALEQMR